MISINSKWIPSKGMYLGLPILISLLIPPVVEARKKKRSIAEIAALEWKLDQSTNVITTHSDVAERKKALAELATVDDPRIAKPLARALKEDPNASIRLKAAEVLAATIKSPEVKGLLQLASTSDPDSNVRAKTRELFSKFPKRMKVAALPLKAKPFKAPKKKVDIKLVRQILQMPSGDARLWAIKKLTKLKKAKGRFALLDTHLFKDPSARVRVEAAAGYVTLKKSKALPKLIHAISDGNPLVRFEIARLVATFDDVGALAVLQKLANSDANNKVRAEAKDLMEPTTPVGKRLLEKRIKKLASARPVNRIAALNELSTFTHWRAMVPMSCVLLNDKSVLVRTKAAKVLVNMHDTSVLTALRVAARLESDKKLKKMIRKQLVGMRRKVDQLIKQLQKGDPNQRVMAARALGQAAYPPGLQALIKVTTDKDPRVRLTAVRGLQNFSSPKVDNALKLIGSDPDPRIRIEVDQFFKKQQRLKKYRSFFKDSNRVVMKTTDKDAIWREDASIALGISGAESAVGTLAQLLLHDKEESVRLAAAWSLVLMGSDQGEIALKKAAAKDKSEKVRLTARKYLIIDKVGMDDLLQQLVDDNPSVRHDAAEALSLRPKRRIINSMIRAALCDSEIHVRTSAMRALARIGNPMARTAIKVAMTRDPSKRVRRVAYMMYILAGGK